LLAIEQLLRVVFDCDQRRGRRTRTDRVSVHPAAITPIAHHDLLRITSAFLVSAMRRSAIIPAGSWPRRMPAAIAAGYCGETTVEAFLKRVGIEYPQPRIKQGRRQLWLRDDLDRAIAPDLVPGDLAADL